MIWPNLATDGLDAMVVQMEGGSLVTELKAVKSIRDGGMSAELYPAKAKLKKQFKYANDRGVRWVLIFGEQELAAGHVMLKDMQEGSQKATTLEEAISVIGS